MNGTRDEVLRLSRRTLPGIAQMRARLSAHWRFSEIDFSQPPGEPALGSPDSVSWRVFKNPIALFVGGVAAVLLELAEPRVRSGVWDHTRFRVDPVGRMRRTGLAAMITVYGPRSAAEAMIARIARMHAKVEGVTSAGIPYRADEPELLDWVQVTASYGFLNAYHAFVEPLSAADRDRFYAEATRSARLYGALNAPRSEAEAAALLQAMSPVLERSGVIFEFLDILRHAHALPRPLRPIQPLLIRAAVEILPDWLREILCLGPDERLRPWEARVVALAGRALERVPLTSAPPAQACLRLGLPANHLYRG